MIDIADDRLDDPDLRELWLEWRAARDKNTTLGALLIASIAIHLIITLFG